MYKRFDSNYSSVPTDSANVPTAAGNHVPVADCKVTLETRGLVGKAQEGTAGI